MVTESHTGLGWKAPQKSSISNLLPWPGISLIFKDVLKALLGLPLLLAPLPSITPTPALSPAHVPAKILPGNVKTAEKKHPGVFLSIPSSLRAATEREKTPKGKSPEQAGAAAAWEGLRITGLALMRFPGNQDK